VTKRGPAFTAEALECLGGNGYVEESHMPRLYREAPLNSIWEGSGNVNALDVLRALGKEPATADALMAELTPAKGADQRLDATLHRLGSELSDLDGVDGRARRLVESMALALQGSLLVRPASRRRRLLRHATWRRLGAYLRHVAGHRRRSRDPRPCTAGHVIIVTALAAAPHPQDRPDLGRKYSRPCRSR
jgi:Acyl-CoA dehydrogenase, C-terminal domain